MTLTRQHRHLRWARQCQRWQHLNWQSFLMRAGSSYSELMAGLGYTDVRERKQLCAVFRRLPFGGGSVMVLANSGQTLL